jgi:hypothetical protein
MLFAILPAWGLGNAAATMVGQALGAGKPDRAEDGGVDGWPLQRGIHGRARRTVPDRRAADRVVFTTTRRLRPRGGLPAHRESRVRVLAYGLVLTQAFNGAGDPWTPTWINFAASGCGRSRWRGCSRMKLGWGRRGCTGHHHCVLDARRRERAGLPPGVVEGEDGLMSAFVGYATWAAFQNAHYTYGPYLSPFYAPELFGDARTRGSGRSRPPGRAGCRSRPALLILPFPGLFRLTCYYYRGAYYKAFWADPPSCAVGEPRGVLG